MDGTIYYQLFKLLYRHRWYNCWLICPSFGWFWSLWNIFTELKGSTTNHQVLNHWVLNHHFPWAMMIMTIVLKKINHDCLRIFLWWLRAAGLPPQRALTCRVNARLSRFVQPVPTRWQRDDVEGGTGCWSVLVTGVSRSQCRFNRLTSG